MREAKVRDLPLLLIEEAKGAVYKHSDDVAKSMSVEAQMDRECAWVLHLNGANRVIKKEMVAMGAGNMALITPREVFRRAIIEGSAKIIIVHNHPSDDPRESDSDKMVSAKLVEAGKLLGVKVLDFIVIAPSGYTSFADKGIGGL